MAEQSVEDLVRDVQADIQGLFKIATDQLERNADLQASLKSQGRLITLLEKQAEALASKLKDLADHAGALVKMQEYGYELGGVSLDKLANAVRAAREELERARKAGIFVAAPTSKEI